ncbi:WD repeat-containing protein 97 isoform X2 [Phyllobates terribilis]|uniref:WD repeat-containing protein 97 isoform X2 n=1 Tax=Phyllobates terribilis TaxID=111132 RepID=UPI003CCB0F4D
MTTRRGATRSQTRGAQTMDTRVKSQELWRRLRRERRSLIVQMRRAELQPSILVHGLQLLRRVAVPVPLLCAVHTRELRSLVSLDCAGMVRLHYEDWRLRDSVQLQWPVSGLLYVGRVQQYVAWNQQELLLLDESFLLLSRHPVQQGVSSCIYHPSINLVLSAGAGGVLVWSVGHSRRSLVLHRRLGMAEEDTVAALTTGSESPHVHMCYAACGTSVWEYDLMDGTLRRVRQHLHARVISGLLYSAELHLLISGSRDGSIKVWDSAGLLVAVFVGHTGPVTVLSLTSSGTVLVSGSEDASLRTWDLTTQEQMEEQRMSGPVLGLVAFFSSEDRIVSYGRNELHVWQVQHLYQLHCILGTPVTTIIVNEALTPSRTLCVCADGTVRLICTSTGRPVAMLDGGERLLAAEYCPLQEMVCALLGDGHLLKASALTHPMRVVSSMKVSSSQSRSCCFCLFSYNVDKKVAETDGTAAGSQQREEGSKEKDTRTRHRFFCIIGSDDGRLQVYNLYSDQLQCDTEAHSPGRVTGLMSIPEKQYIISAGSDLTVKVWRLYPHSEESLCLCLSFFCARPVGRMCCLQSQLFVAFDDDSSATYTLVQYCLETGTRSDHPPNHDHQDQITGLCSSPDLGLVVSCGRDRMIRIWTEENRLLRLLHLHGSPDSLSLCSSRGELFMGIHGHIYRMSLMTVLPQPYKLKIMCMVSPPAAPDPPNPVEDMKRADPVHRSSIDSGNESKVKTEQNQEEFSLLSARDQDLHLIQMGKLRSHKRTTSNKETRREAMEKYLQLMYQEKPSFIIPVQDDFDPDELLKSSEVQEPKTSPFSPPQKSHGFFTDSALGFSIDLIPKHLQTSFFAAGVVPNSALLQLLWPMKIEEDRRLVKRRNHLQPLHTQLAETSQKTSEMEKEKKNAESEETAEAIAEEMSDVDEVPSILQNILASVNTKDKPPVVPETCSPPLQSPPPQSHKQARSTMLQKTRLSRIPRPHPIQTKTFQERFIPVQLPPQTPPLCPPANKACSTASTSLQDDELSVKSPEMLAVPEIPPFILQFQDQSWFYLILPEAEVPYPDFESRLLRALLQTGPPMCTQLLHALQTLHRQGHLKYPERLLRTLADVINREADLTVCEQQEFVWLCLHFMNNLSRESRELMVELLVTCTQLPATHRGRFFALFNEFGVHDPHGFIAKKCSSWDGWDETGSGREGLKKICEDWLWLWTFRLMDQLHGVTAYNKEPWTSHGGKNIIYQPAGSVEGNTARRQKPQERLEDDVTAVDVLNYYCEIQKRELQMLQDCDPGRGSTVLALPPISRWKLLCSSPISTF